MNKKRVWYGLATILLFLGFVLAFLPHTTHAQLGLKDDHSFHIISGMIAVVIALLILIWSSGARIRLGR